MSIKNGSNIFVSQEEDCIYVDGVRYVPESTNDWVSVDERPPDEDEMVDVWHINNTRLSHVQWSTGEWWDTINCRWMLPKHVTYWRYMPEPPKEK